MDRWKKIVGFCFILMVCLAGCTGKEQENHLEENVKEALEVPAQTPKAARGKYSKDFSVPYLWSNDGYIYYVEKDGLYRFLDGDTKTDLLVKWNNKADGQEIYFCDSDKQVYAVVTEIAADFEKVKRLYIFSKEEKEYTCINLDFAESEFEFKNRYS